MSAQIIQFPPAGGATSPTLVSMVLTLQRDNLRALSWRERAFLHRVSVALLIGSDADQEWAAEHLDRIAKLWRRVTGGPEAA